MALSPHTTSLFARFVTSALVAAAIAVPAAQASVDTHGPSAAGKYGLLDPAIATAIRNHLWAQSVALGIEHAAGQNGTGQANAAVKYGSLDTAIATAIRAHQWAQSVALGLDQAVGQNGTGQAKAAGKYGPLDPAITTAIRGHSWERNGASRSAVPSAPVAAPDGFDWGAAGIGATVVFAAVLLGLGVPRFVSRLGRRGRLA